jgi:hypothetical protein
VENQHQLHVRDGLMTDLIFIFPVFPHAPLLSSTMSSLLTPLTMADSFNNWSVVLIEAFW